MLINCLFLLIGEFVYEYSGYRDCIRKSIAVDGYKVFSKGLNATLLRAFPTNAATFTVSIQISYIQVSSIRYLLAMSLFTVWFKVNVL